MTRMFELALLTFVAIMITIGVNVGFRKGFGISQCNKLFFLNEND